MIKPRPVLLSVAALALCLFYSGANGVGQPLYAANESSIEVLAGEASGLAAAINQQRIAADLPVLTVDQTLGEIARGRSEDQLDRHYYSHTTPEGNTVLDILDEAGIPWTAAGENLEFVRGKPPVPAAIDDFMASPEHRANVLDPAYDRFGVGVAESSDGSTILTVVFTN